jgi:uncharacterized membrane protein SpoIIM required for sporulation
MKVMKRVLFGILWFIVSWLLLNVVNMIVMGVVISSSSGASGYHDSFQAGIAFAREHAGLMIGIRLGILVAALLIALIGSVKGVLPGTRRSTL